MKVNRKSTEESSKLGCLFNDVNDLSGSGANALLCQLLHNVMASGK